MTGPISHIQHAICQLRWWSSVNIQARPHAVGEQVAGVEQNFMSAGKKKNAPFCYVLANTLVSTPFDLMKGPPTNYNVLKCAGWIFCWCKFWKTMPQTIFKWYPKCNILYIYIWSPPPQNPPPSCFNGIYSIKCLFCKIKKWFVFCFSFKVLYSKTFKNPVILTCFLVYIFKN